MIKSNAQKGFTLMEVIIVTFLFGILLMGLMQVFDWHQKVFQLEQAEVRATGSVRSTLNDMSEYIAQGNRIVANRTINGQTYNSGSGALVLELPAVNSSGNIIGGTYDYVTYYLTGSELYQVIQPGNGSVRIGNTKQLSSVMESAVFTYNNPDPTLASIVNVDLQARAKSRGDSTVAIHITDTIFLRNR